MAKALPLPDGTTVAIREGETPAQTWARAQQMYPEAFGETEEKKPKQDTTGFKAAVSSGFTRLGGEMELLKGKAGFKSEAEAQKEYEAAQAKAAARFTPTEKDWTEDPFLKFKETLGGSVPYMVAPAAAGIAALAAPVAAPVAAGLGLLGAGAVSTGQFTASNLAKQMETGKSLEEASLGKAVAAAIPQAALDTAAMALIPGIGKLFGSVGSKLTTEQARAIANQTLGKTIMDYTAKTGVTAGREGVTEAAQQVLERLQAGLSITDPEARKEYVDSFIGGAVLGGTLAPAGRYMERGAAKTQAEKADSEDKKAVAKQAAQAQQVEQAKQEAERNTPEYAQKIVADYQAAEKVRRDLEGQIQKVSKDSPTYTADKEQNKAIGLQLRQQAAELKGMAGEYNRVKGIAAQAEQNKPFELTPSPAETPAAAQEPTESPTQMLERKRQAQQLLENNQQELSDYTANNDMAGFDSAMKQRKVLMSEVSQLDTQMKALGIQDNQIDPVAIQTQIGKETDKLTSMAGPGFDPDKAEKQRAKIGRLQTQLQNATSGQMGLDLGAPRTLELPLTAAQNQRDAMAAKGTAAGAQRISTVEQEEQAALQAQRDEETRLAQEAETNRQRAAKVAPEMAALQRMRQRPSPITEGMTQFEGQEGAPTTSPAFGQMQQDLLGTPEEERMLPTAEGEKKRDLRRVPGAEFKLRPRLEGTPVPSREELADRLNRVLTTHELSADAVDLLRRVEQALPAKLDPDYANALDQQLSRIESGEEGVPRKGQGRTELLQTFPTETPTRAETAAPTEAYKKELDEITGAAPGQAASVSQQEMYAQRQRLEDTGKPGKLPGFVAQPEDEARRSVLAGTPEVTKRADATTATTLRGPSAAPGSVLSSTTRNSLTLGNDLAPYLQMAEQAAAEDAGQMSLFPKEDRELLGVVKEDAAAFQRFMNSPFLRNLRIQMQKDRTKVASANTFLSRALPKLQAMVAEAKAVEVRMGKLKRWENFVDANKDLLNLQADTKNMALRINNLKLEKSDLSARIESYEQARERVIKESQRAGAAGKGRIEPVRKELFNLIALIEEAQAARMQTQGLLDLLQAQTKVLIGEQRIAQLKAEATTTDAVNASAQDEIARLREAVTQAQETVTTEGREKKRAAVAATRAETGATAANTRSLTQDISDTRTRLWNTFLSSKAADKGTRVRALTEAERAAREKGLTSDGAKEIQYANELYNKPLKWLEQEKGNVEKRLVEAEKQVRAAKKRSGEFVGGEQNVQAFKGLGAAIRLQANASVRLESLEDAIAFRRAQDEDRTTSTAPRTITPDTENAALLEDAFAILKNKPAIKGKVSQATRIQSSAPGKLRTGTEESKANAGVTKQPIVESRQVDETNTAITSEDMRIANEEAARMQSMSKKEKNKAAREAKANEKAEQEMSGADAELEAVMRKQNKAIQNKKGEDSVLFRTVETKGTPTLETQQVENLAKRVTEGWVNAPTIKVVANEKGLPVRILTQLTKDEKRGKVPGLYDTETKTVYLIADALHNANDVILTIAHEAAGHHGLRELLGGTYTKTMDDIFAGNKEVRQQTQAKMAAEPNLSQQVAVEEVLAELAEKQNPTPAEKNALQRIYAALKQWFAKTFNLPNVTDAEVQQLVANARQYVIEGRKAAEGQAPTGKAVLRTKTAQPTNALEQLAQDVIAQPKTWRDKMGNHVALQAEMQAVDMRAGLEAALKAGAKELGDENLYTQAMYNVRKADQKMPLIDTVMRLGPLELYKDDKGLYGVRSTNKNSAKDVLEAVAALPYKTAAEKDNIATIYMIAQRAANKGLSKLDLGALGVTEEKLNAAMAVVDADPVLKDALENVRRVYNEYNKGLINFLVESRRISKAFSKELLKDGDYVPYYRVQDNGLATLNFGNNKMVTVGDIRRQPYLAQLKGGETKILPISESLPRNTLLLTDMALSNMSTRSVAYGLQAIGKGKGDIDPQTGKPKNLMAIHSGDGPADGRTIRFYEEPDPNKADDDGKRWVQVDTGGTAIEGIPAELVVQSLEGAHLALPEILKLAGAAGDLLRTGVTRTPLYIARQLFKDPMAAAFTGGLNYNAFTAVLKAGKEFVKMTRGTSENEAKLLEKGLIQSGIFAGDVSDMKKMALQIASGKDTSTVDKIFAALDRAAMRADATTRALVMENALKNGLSEVEADMATMESMNFYKRGLSPTVQYANRMIPFLNAQIQGLNVLYKAATGKMPFEEQQKIKRKFVNNAALLTATGIVYAMAMEDDEYFRNAKPKDKYSNFFLHLPGVDEPVKLPIPYEAGYFFSLAVAAVDGMREETDGAAQWRALKDLFLGSIPGYSSMGMPQIVKPAFEVWTNKNFLTGAPIESLRLQGLDPEERYNTTTTELAKGLAKAVPILSPIQIEHLVRGYLGVLPLAAAAAANGIFASETKGERPEGRTSDLPLIGTQFQKKFGGADNEVVFHLADEAKQARSTFNNMLKEGRREDAIEYRDSHRVALASAAAAGQYQQLVGRINLDVRRTQERNDLSPAEKRERLDKLDEAKQGAAQRFIQVVKRLESAAS
jgi:hypothetical protein